MTTTTTTTAPSASAHDLLAGFGPFDSMPIGGRWRPGGGEGVLTDHDPWSGDQLAELRPASAADVEEAYDVARRAQVGWAQRLPAERAEVMLRAAAVIEERHDEVAAWVTAESGGTVGKVAVELAVTRAVFLEAAGMTHHAEGAILPSDIPGKENRVYRRPVGVVCLISPWDFPIYLTSRSLAPALALGNAVVLKPSSETPVTGGLLLARILELAGLPEGVLSVVAGPSSEIGDALVASRVPRVLSFTGSTEAGIAISRTAGLKRLLLELGGNAPLVVLDDADLPYAVESAVFGSFYNSGQICMIANRVIVDRTLHDDFVEAFVERARGLTVGDPSDPRTFVGPVISRRQLDSVRDKVDRSVAAGARLLLGGDSVGPAGLTLPPHVLVGDNTVPTASEEVFGPAITIVLAEGEAHALELANQTEYGLSSAVHTRDHRRGLAFALRIEAGMTHLNDSPVNEEDNTAYGGEKQSGLGRFGGRWSLDEFTTHQWVSVQHDPRPYPLS
ncbi:aldehyde dehydrogenase family protein [Nocardioides sp. CN2-186]|uniref:aldehyde dehydrogenase family protein n=1 Tax=Nocardioides tweenelious TaxID=3156607 RepID=UPI0032B55195